MRYGVSFPPPTQCNKLSEKGLSYKKTMNMKTFSIYNNDQENGFMLNVTDWCHFSSYWEGDVPSIRDIIMFLWHESEAQDLSRLADVP